MCGRVIVGVVACVVGVLEFHCLLHFLQLNGLDPQDTFSMSSASPKASLQVHTARISHKQHAHASSNLQNKGVSG